MTRRSTPCEQRRPLLLALLIAGCAAHQPGLRFETASDLAMDEPRRPTGVAVDPASEVPEATPQGDAARALLVLRPPADLSAAYSVVRAFFAAVVKEDIAELERLLTDNASLELDAQTGKRRAGALWRSRLAQLDYNRLPGQELYRESEIEAYRKSDFEELESRSRPKVELDDQDVVLKVPLLVTKLDKVRVFGSEIVFVLKPLGRSFKIAEMIEPFQLQ
jgi:hypothetical protein